MPAPLTLPTPLDLALHLAQNGQGVAAALQTHIRNRLAADTDMRSWLRARSLLKNSPEFRKYRKSSRQYNDAARAMSAGTATHGQTALVTGLSGEIAASQVQLPLGQVLFHGRGDRALDITSPYPAFVSATLDATVGRWFAITCAAHVSGSPVIYILRLQRPIRALLGHSYRSHESEVLLPPCLTYAVRAVHGGAITVVEVDVT